MIKLLDHGSIELVETWGSEERIIEAARMSTGGSFRGWDKDEKLLRYLYKNKHMTPFEMAGAVFEVKAPIFVLREWMRHRSSSFNEMSARYVEIPDETYLPTIERCLIVGDTNKQAMGEKEHISEEATAIWLEQLEALYRQAAEVYSSGLAIGIPRELARLAMTVGRYSKMRVQCNLRNWLHFIGLRSASNAQYEIKVYSDEIDKILDGIFPRTMALFREFGE